MITTPAQSFVVALERPGGPHGAGASAGKPTRSLATIGGRSPQLKAFERAFKEKLKEVRGASAVLVFVSSSDGVAEEIAHYVAEVAPDVRGLVVPGAGVLSEAAEVEGLPAASGMIWSGSKPRIEIGPEELGNESGVRLLFATKALDREALKKIEGSFTIGAGTNATRVFAIRDGGVHPASMAALVVRGAGAPVVETASAAKPVSEPMAITAFQGRAILEIEGKPALDVFSAKVGGGKFADLVLAAVALPGERRAFGPIQGIDTDKRALVLDSPIREGAQLSFGVHDASHAKAGLAESARRAGSQALGSVPRFALFLSCTSRGRSLYREADVDIRILKKQFPKLPIAGMHSSFQIIPVGEAQDRVAIELLSSVLALFKTPS